jgi:hypothetical protein
MSVKDLHKNHPFFIITNFRGAVHEISQKNESNS